MEEIGITETPREEVGAPVKSANPLTTTYDELDADDLYVKFKKLQQQLEFLGVQEEYIKDEMRNLRKEYIHAQEEVKRIQSVPLVIGQFLEAVDQNTGIVGSTTGSNYYVRILSTLDRELLKPSASVALHKHSNALVKLINDHFMSNLIIYPCRLTSCHPRQTAPSLCWGPTRSPT